MDNLPIWLYILMFSTIILEIVLNLIKIAVLFKKNQRKSYEKILLSMAIGEVIFLMIQICCLVVKYTIPHFHHWCRVGLSCAAFGDLLIVLLHLICISADRVWAVAAPIHHLVHSRNKETCIAIFLCWCIPIPFTIRYLIKMLHQSSLKSMAMEEIMSYPGFRLAVVILVTDIMFLICYVTIIVIIYKNKPPTTVNTEVHRSQNRNQIRSTSNGRERRVLGLCMGTIFVFICCTTPFVVSYIKLWKAPAHFQLSSIHILTLNGIVNSVIYLAQNGCIFKNQN